MGEEVEVTKLFYDYETLVGDLQHIVRDMSVAQYKPDVVIGPGRGAYFPGVMLSHYFYCVSFGFPSSSFPPSLQFAFLRLRCRPSLIMCGRLSMFSLYYSWWR